MSITIDANLTYIQNKLSISSSRMQNYTDKTVDEIITAEANSGNTKALEYARELYSNPKKLIKSLDLENPNNKFILLQEMDEKDVLKVMEGIKKEDLLLGLNFFTQEKMLELLEEVPAEELVNMTLELFKLDQVLDMIPEKELQNFMKNTELEKELVINNLEKLPPEFLAQVIETMTGFPVDELDPKQLSSQIASLGNDEFEEAMEYMDPKATRALIMAMSEENPEILQLFPAENYTNVLNTLQKPEMMEGTVALEAESVITMLGELPKELMSIVATQIDTEEFAEELIRNHKDVLESIITSAVAV